MDYRTLWDGRRDEDAVVVEHSNVMAHPNNDRLVVGECTAEAIVLLMVTQERTYFSP